jgi:hypothetical protein
MAGNLISYAEAQSANLAKVLHMVDEKERCERALFEAWKRKFGIEHADPYPPQVAAPPPPAPAPPPAPRPDYSAA